jgi:hypothetical protein
MGPTIGPAVAQVWVQLTHENGVDSIVGLTLRAPTLTGLTFAP